jgi:hypothetical protein
MRSEDFQAAVLRNPVHDALLDDLIERALPDAWIVAWCRPCGISGPDAR